MRKVYMLGLTALLAAASMSVFQTQIRAEKTTKYKTSPNPIQNRYIVVLSDNLSSDVAETTNNLSTEYFGTIDKVYEDAVKGYSVETTSEEARRLSEDPRIKYVEEDTWFLPTEVEYNPYWALDRIDQHA